jgi:hypothetical protein
MRCNFFIPYLSTLVVVLSAQYMAMYSWLSLTRECTELLLFRFSILLHKVLDVFCLVLGFITTRQKELD